MSARAASLLSDGVVLVLTAIKTFRVRRATSDSTRGRSLLTDIMLRDSTCRSSHEMMNPDYCWQPCSVLRELRVNETYLGSLILRCFLRLLCTVNVLGLATGHLTLTIRGIFCDCEVRPRGFLLRRLTQYHGLPYHAVHRSLAVRDGNVSSAHNMTPKCSPNIGTASILYCSLVSH